MRRIALLPVLLPVLLALTSLTSCSVVGTDDGDHEGHEGSAHEVVLVTHESFVMGDELVAQFEEESGYDLVLKASGDAGALTNKLVLTKDNPTGDAVFGIDNTFGSRAIDEGVLEAYDAELPDGAEDYLLGGDDDQALTPVDTGNVCVNVDDTYLVPPRASSPPVTLEDLTKPDYRTCSCPRRDDELARPGVPARDDRRVRRRLARLLDPAARQRRQAHRGLDRRLPVDFTQGGGGGDRPIVLSYDSSPAFTVDGEGGTTTSALLDTCFRQVEYAGVLAGAENPEGARALVDFMLGRGLPGGAARGDVRLPGRPTAVELPADWAEFAVQPEAPYVLDPAEIAANRDDWLTEWSDLTSR